MVEGGGIAGRCFQCNSALGRRWKPGGVARGLPALSQSDLLVCMFEVTCSDLLGEPWRAAWLSPLGQFSFSKKKVSCNQTWVPAGHLRIKYSTCVARVTLCATPLGIQKGNTALQARRAVAKPSENPLCGSSAGAPIQRAPSASAPRGSTLDPPPRRSPTRAAPTTARHSHEACAARCSCEGSGREPYPPLWLRGAKCAWFKYEEELSPQCTRQGKASSSD